MVNVPRLRHGTHPRLFSGAAPNSSSNHRPARLLTGMMKPTGEIYSL